MKLLGLQGLVRMKEPRVIAAELEKRRSAGARGVLATVPTVEGSGYRRPGVRMPIIEAG